MLAALACTVVLAGCNNGGGVEFGVDGNESKVPSADTCEGNDCSQEGVDIRESPCGERIAEMPGLQMVDPVGLSGEGVIRIMTSVVESPVCEKLYWAEVLFSTSTNTTPYAMVLAISDNGGGARSTPSVSPVNPATKAVITTMLKGRPGQHLEACINSVPAKPEPVCTTVDVP